MALPTTRQPGDVISASDINDIATQVNTNTTAVAGKLSTSGGTMSGAINMGSKKITSLATPTANTDAATKAYADGLKPTYNNKTSNTGITTNNVVIYTNSLTVPVIVMINYACTLTSGRTEGVGGITTPNGTALANNFTDDMGFMQGNATVVVAPGATIRSYLYNMASIDYYFETFKFGS